MAQLNCWASKQQPIIALSSCEAEYIACSDTCRETVYLRRLYLELQAALGMRILDAPTVHHIDNMSAKFLAETKETKKSKHMEIRYHWIRQQIGLKRIVLKFVGTKEQLADCLTKALLKHDFCRLRGEINCLAVQLT